MTLFDQILKMQDLVDAIASNSKYRELKEGNRLVNLNIQLSDIEIYLWLLNEILIATTEATHVEQQPSRTA